MSGEGDSERSAPLAGLRVVDLSRMAPGPFATMHLGDWGADVITVEAPSPETPMAPLPLHDGAGSRAAGLNPLFRSRRSIVVDAKRRQGADLIRRLAAEADVFVEGFRPGVCERLGFGYEQLADENPGIVYCSISGYGGDGAHAGVAGHDINYLAEAGMLATTTRDGERPAIPLNVVADHAAGGLYAALSILIALRGRDLTGVGTHIDVSMTAGVLNLLQVVPAWIEAGGPDPSWGEGMLSGAAPFYDSYRTADGRWMSVGAIEPKFFANLCDALELPELAAAQLDQGRWAEIRERFAAAFVGRTQAEWEARLDGPDLCVAPVRSIREGFEVWRSRGAYGPEDRCGPRLSSWRPVPTEPVRKAGLHSRQILREGGLSDTEIDALLRKGVVAEQSLANVSSTKGAVR